jgi:hypothetical protein
METKKGGFKTIVESFHQTSWNFVGISTVVCGSFWGVEKIQNGGRCHGNQGAKNVKFTPYSWSFLKLDTKIDHHSKLCSLFLKFSKWPPI